MTLETFLSNLDAQPDTVQFSDTITLIEETYTFTPSEFTNGRLKNIAGQNNGSCKIFAFGLLNGLSEMQTLLCFGDYYRKDVLQNPTGEDHQNIRNFMKSGWNGVRFAEDALVLKQPVQLR